MKKSVRKRERRLLFVCLTLKIIVTREQGEKLNEEVRKDERQIKQRWQER